MSYVCHRKLVAVFVLVILAVLIVVFGNRFTMLRNIQLSREGELQSRVEDVEEQLRLQQRRFSMVMDSSPVGVVMCDERGIITAANATLANMLGYAKNELLGKSSSVLVADGFRSVHNKCMGQAPGKFMKDNKSLQSHFSGDAKKKDGTPIHVSIACRGLLVDGRPEFVAFIRPDDVPKEPIFESPRAN